MICTVFQHHDQKGQTVLCPFVTLPFCCKEEFKHQRQIVTQLIIRHLQSEHLIQYFQFGYPLATYFLIVIFKAYYIKICISVKIKCVGVDLMDIVETDIMHIFLVLLYIRKRWMGRIERPIKFTWMKIYFPWKG